MGLSLLRRATPSWIYLGPSIRPMRAALAAESLRLITDYPARETISSPGEFQGEPPEDRQVKRPSRGRK